MRLDVDKINDRINRLQELKRLAADPDLLAMLYEFTTPDEDSLDSSVDLRAAAAAIGKRESASAPDMAPVSEVVKGVLDATSTQPARGSDGYGLLGRRRA